MSPTIPAQPRSSGSDANGSYHGVFPASFAQQHLWVLQQFQPTDPTYNVPAVVWIRGDVQKNLLASTLGVIVSRHEALRTTFESRDGKVLQVIRPSPSSILRTLDLEEPSVEAAERRALEIARVESSEPFNLATGALMRALLIRIARDRSLLVLTMHHIACDGWSVAILMREMAATYRDLLVNGRSLLPSLGTHYVDYALWQRERVAGALEAKLLEFWRRQLADAPSLDIPVDFPRPPVISSRGAASLVAVEAELVAQLRALGARCGATLFMTLLSGYLILLHRYSRQQVVLIGSQVAGRTCTEVEDLIGPFVNTVVFRGDLAGDPTILELIARVRSTAVDTYAHQEYPFELLTTKLQPRRDASQTPFFQVMFSMSTPLPERIELPGLSLEIAELEVESAKADLALFLSERNAGVQGRLEYRSELFAPATIARMTAHLHQLLVEMVKSPSRRLSQLNPLVTEREARQVLIDGNAGAPAGETLEGCLHELFGQQAARTPDAIAVELGDEHLSYGEFDRRANDVAGRLRGMGAGPEILVGLSLERNVDLLISLVGVLKAGAAYVPLDPAWPTLRVQQMIEEAGIGLVVTKSPGAFAERSIRTLDPSPGAGSQGDHVPTACAVPADCIAYVLFTSGSTGRPKAVAISHRSAVALVGWGKGQFTDAEVRRVLAATHLSFDVSVFEIFGTLLRGGTLILVDNLLEMGAVAAAEATLIHTVPSVLAALLDKSALPSTILTVNLAGEALPGQLVERLAKQRRPPRVFNLYGPTEDTTYSTGCEIREDSAGAPPIGRPLPGKRVYLLDEYQRPVPIGVPGEICLSGGGLARCYLNRPHLTAERFTPNPFVPGQRLYHTGDLGRLRPDGNVMFLSRIDQQLKIHGIRIEPGEIESILRRHASVRDVVVVAPPAPANRLLAYVVSREDLGLRSPAQLNQHLRQWLPSTMIPRVVFLESFPMTTSGKVNRRALSESTEGVRTSVRESRPPRGDLEIKIAALWQEALRPSSEILASDNFFDLGGHSLLAIQVLMDIERVTGVRLSPLELIFSTLEQAAALCDERLLRKV